MRPADLIYDRATIALHWLIVVLVLWLSETFLETVLPKGALRSDIWSAHFVLGFLLAALAVALLAWRRTNGRQLPVEDPVLLHRVAKATLYALLFLMVGLGIANGLDLPLVAPLGMIELD